MGMIDMDIDFEDFMTHGVEGARLGMTIKRFSQEELDDFGAPALEPETLRVDFPIFVLDKSGALMNLLVGRFGRLDSIGLCKAVWGVDRQLLIKRNDILYDSVGGNAYTVIGIWKLTPSILMLNLKLGEKSVGIS